MIQEYELFFDWTIQFQFFFYRLLYYLQFWQPFFVRLNEELVFNLFFIQEDFFIL